MPSHFCARCASIFCLPSVGASAKKQQVPHWALARFGMTKVFVGAGEERQFLFDFLLAFGWASAANSRFLTGLGARFGMTKGLGAGFAAEERTADSSFLRFAQASE
jgi:hypothetical protein